MRIAIALAVACAIGLSGMAHAQRLRDDAAAVAGPTASGARLLVWDDGQYICGAAVPPRRRGFSSTCASPPRTLRSPLISTSHNSSGPRHVWGIVAPEVASVEVVFAHGRRLQGPTSSGERYRGKRAGTLRFFLIEGRWERTDYPLYLRLLGQDGALLAAVGADSYQPAPASKRLVAQGRVGEARWLLSAFTRPAHAPLLGDEERVVTQRCLELRVRGRGNSPQAGGGACDEPDYPSRPLLDLQRTCGPVGVQLAGLVPRGAGVEAVLGDGRRVRPAPIRLPRGFGEMRAFALVLAPDVALRSLATIETGRREVLARGIGPGLADCPNTSSGWYFGFDLELPRFGAEPPALKLRDDGVLLCATLGLPDPEGRDCGPPPLDAESSRVLSHVTPDSTTIAGVVTPDVGSVEVVFAGGGTQLVPTAEATYPGRYRGLIRSFSLTVPGERDPRAARLIGVDGRRVGSIRLFSWPEFVADPRTVLRSPGGWRLAAGIASGGGLAGRRLGCLQLTRGEPSDDVLSCDAFGSSKHVTVTCIPRRMLVYGQVAPGVRRVEVRTTRGVVTARVASLRRLGISGRAFLAELPANAALRGLEVHADRVRRPRLSLPPASRQCGYGESF